MSEWFDRASRLIAAAGGSWIASMLAALIVVLWCIAGIWVGFSDILFQMVINTVTTIITFLMVFIIQHTQVRDTEAMHLKLDELILAIDAARNEYRGIEQRTEEELKPLMEISE